MATYNSNKVELIGWYGGDVTHSLSAWTSTARELTDEKLGRMDKLLDMLAREGHHTPFEKSYLHFLVNCDTASHIHIIKHRIGVSVNGESARYKELKGNKCYVPEDWPDHVKDTFMNHVDRSYDYYHEILDELELAGFERKRAKESARFILPYGNQLTLDVGFNFRSFAAFQSLRNDDHAQDEIHEIAQGMVDLVESIPDEPFKLSIDAFRKAKLIP
jgi:flavin-dependent thymidylate synthase